MQLALTHEEAQALLAAFALDAVEWPVREALRAHAEACPACVEELVSLRETAAALAWLAPPAPMDEERARAMRARLVARAGADDTPRPARAATPLDAATVRAFPSPPSSEALGRRPGTLDVVRHEPAWTWHRAPSAATRWAAAAAILLALLLGGALWRTTASRGALRRQLAATRAERDSAMAMLAARDSAIGELARAGVRVVTLAPATRSARPGDAPSARLFRDEESGAWTLVARGLARPPAGRRYQLWLETRDGRRTPAASFLPALDGSAVVRAARSASRGALERALVTLEPAAGSFEPTMPAVMEGRAEER